MPDPRSDQRRSSRPMKRLLKLVSSRKESNVVSNSSDVTDPLPSIRKQESSRQDDTSKLDLPGITKEVQAVRLGLWEEAYDEIAKISSIDIPELRRRLLATDEGSDSYAIGSLEWRICNEVRDIAIERQMQCRKNTSNPLAAKLIETYGSIVFYIQKFVSVGDVVAQIDPLHVGLPWAGIRAILLISVHGQLCDLALLNGVSDISKLIHRYAVFEEVYLKNKIALEEALEARLKASLKELYAAILLYLFEALKYWDRSSGERLFKALTLSDDLEHRAKDIAVKESEVQNYERLAVRAASYAQFLEVRTILGSYDDHIQSEQRQKISSWISDIPYSDHHRQIHSTVLAGTGAWFFERAEYCEWSNSVCSSLLWLRGNAGTGKSSLISCAIDRLRQEPDLDSARAMAYFYCSRISSDTRRQNPRDILQNILKQLSAPFPGLPIKPPVLSKYREEITMGSLQAMLSIQETTKLITELIQKYYTHVTIIVDALDECDARTRSDLFRYLERLAYTPESVVKILISSRNEPDIGKYFHGLSTLFINAEDNADDIEKYVDFQIDSRLLHGKADNVTKSLVKRKINGKSKGIFRWAALQVESLCDPEYVHTGEDVIELLKKLPETLEATYAETLETFYRYSTVSRDAILNVLKLLMCAEVPMYSDEILSAVTILSGTLSLGQEDLIRMARSLVVEDIETGILSFAHLSVKEYLEGRPDLSGASAHATAAEACLRTYLNEHNTMKISTSGERFSSTRYRFRRYALTHLGRHCKNSKSLREQGRLRDLVMKFLIDEKFKGAFEEWNRECFQTDVETAPGTCEERRNCQSRPAQPLLMASVYGFDEVAKHILAKNIDALDSESFLRNRPLELAALYGNYSTTKMLYHAADGRSISNIRVEKTLCEASRGTLETFSFILDHLRQEVPSSGVLGAAAANEIHGKEMVSLLLDNTSSPDESSICAMIENCASIAAIEAILPRLNSLGVSNSMIRAAAGNRLFGVEIVKSLLMRNQDVIVDEDCFISAASQEETMGDGAALVKLLLAHPKRCNITEDILRKIALGRGAHTTRCLQLLIPHVRDFEVTEDLLSAAATNDPSILEFVINLSKPPEITQQILQSAILNRWNAMESLKLLLSQPSCPDISDETIIIIMETWSGSSGLLKFVFEQTPTARVTEGLFTMAVRHRNSTNDNVLA